jgi:hypothetical protein
MSRTSGLPQHELIAQLLRITDELADRFHGVFGRETVAKVVDETYDLLAEKATVTSYLPVLTSRFARQRLADQSRG